MKKLYTILLSAAVALGASAATPKLKVAHQMQNALLETFEGSSFRNPEMKSGTSLLKRMKGAPAKSDAVTWTELGEGQFSDGWYLPRYKITADDFKWTVKVMKSSEGEIYKFVDPFHQANYKALFSGDVKYPFTDDAYDVIVDCTNPEFVKFTFGIGMVVDKTATSAGFGTLTENTPIYLSTAANYFIANGQTESAVTQKDYQNTFSEGRITLSACCFGVGANATEASSGSSFGTPAKAELLIPGAKDYSVNASVITECVTELKLSFQVVAGTDIATSKYFVAKGLYETDAEMFEYLDQQNVFAALPQPTGSWNLTYKSAPDNGDYTLFVAGYDETGKMVAHSGAYYIVEIDKPEEWKSVGTCQFTEDMIGNLYGSNNVAWGTTTYEVEVQENIATPGLFRIVNPYTTEKWPHVANNDHESDHNHFLLIDATDPAKVNIPKSYIGFDGGYGHEFLVSINNTVEETNIDESLWGKFENKTITLPAKSVYDASLIDTNPYTVGKGEFKLVLPDTYGGILGVDADADVNAPVEYFNLQGVRVTNPTEGQLVIRRQGTKVEKVVLK